MWATFKTGISDYTKLINHCFGKGWKIYLDAMIIIIMYGALISYNVLIADFIPKDMKDFNIPSEYYDPAPNARLIQITVLNILIFFIALKRDLTALGFVGSIGFLSVIYTVILICVEAPSFHHKWYEEEGYPFVWTHVSVASIQAFAVSMFAYMQHINVFMVRNEIKRSSEKRMNKIVTRAFMIEVVLYLVCGISGYYSLLGNTPDIIIDRKNLPS